MTSHTYPVLDSDVITDTRDALHAYARILGSWTSTCRSRRKHWWHVSLRPSLNGMTTGVIYTEQIDFEIELNLKESAIIVSTTNADPLHIEIHGQPTRALAEKVREHLAKAGISMKLVSRNCDEDLKFGDIAYAGYSTVQARKMLKVLSAVSATMVSFRSGIRKEASPIQIWPHHFDLSLLWLPGETIAGQDKEDEENSDKQMNFGFIFGDAGIPEPYFYITAYPVPEAFSSIDLPNGATWRSEGFTGVVLPYRSLLEEEDPDALLLNLWNTMLDHGKRHLVEHL